MSTPAILCILLLSISVIITHSVLTTTRSTPTPTAPLLISIAGGSASGKTTLCRTLSSDIRDLRVFHLGSDNFYRPLTSEEFANVSHYDFDSPAAVDWELVLSVVTNITQRKEARVPVYDYVTHSRRDEFQVIDGNVDVLLYEGIFALYDATIREMSDLTVFVDADAEKRLSRRIRRDIVERGRSIENVLAQYERTVSPGYRNFVEPTMRFADVVIPSNEDTARAETVLSGFIQWKRTAFV